MKIYSNGNGSYYDRAMGNGKDIDLAPTESDLEAILAMQEAEDVFEAALKQLERTTPRTGVDAQLILEELVGSWRCVRQARAKAGY